MPYKYNRFQYLDYYQKAAAGGGTLQESYVLGNSITTDSGNGAFGVSGTEDISLATSEGDINITTAGGSGTGDINITTAHGGTGDIIIAATSSSGLVAISTNGPAGMTLDTAAGISIDAIASSNFTMTANHADDRILSIEASNAGAGEGIITFQDSITGPHDLSDLAGANSTKFKRADTGVWEAPVVGTIATTTVGVQAVEYLDGLFQGKQVYRQDWSINPATNASFTTLATIADCTVGAVIGIEGLIENAGDHISLQGYASANAAFFQITAGTDLLQYYLDTNLDAAVVTIRYIKDATY